MNTRANSISNKICTLIVATLILWCVAWETIGSPIRPLSEGYSWMVLKGFLLLPLLHRLWRGERRAYQILSLLILLYVTEGFVRAFSDITFTGRAYAWGEITLSLVIFVCANKIARNLRIMPPDTITMRETKPRPKGWVQLLMYLYSSLLVFTGMSFTYTPDGTESTRVHQIVWIIRVSFIVLNALLLAFFIKNGRAKVAQNRPPPA